MSDEASSSNPIPSDESEGDSIIVLVDSSGHTEDVTIGGSSTAEEQPLLDTSGQTAGRGNTVSSLREKWENIGKKTYAEIAAACPGSKEESFSLLGHSPAEGYEEQKLVSSEDPLRVQTGQVRDQDPEGKDNQGYHHPTGMQIKHPLQEPFTNEDYSSNEDNAPSTNPQEQLGEENFLNGGAIQKQVSDLPFKNHQ